MENVDDQKRQLITQFMELCDVNYDEAHLHLDQFQWDLESALEGFFLSQFEDRENPATINSTASTATQSTEDAHDPTHNTQNMSISNSTDYFSHGVYQQKKNSMSYIDVLTEEGITKFPYFAFARIDQYSNLRLTPIPIATLLFGAMENFVREDVRQVEERRLARIQAEQDSLLMQRQNEEYAESLRIDQIKQQQKISEEFERKKELKKKQDEEDKRTALIEAVKARYANIPKHVSEIQGSIKYRVQFPNGDRIVLAVNEEDPAETLPIFPQWFTRIVEEYATLSHFEIEVPPSGHNLSVKAAGISSGEAFFVADLV